MLMVETMVQASELVAQAKELPSQSMGYSPLMTRESFAKVIGLPVGVLIAQADRGYWPQITVGRRVFINVEAVRIRAAERAEHFALAGA